MFSVRKWFLQKKNTNYSRKELKNSSDRVIFIVLLVVRLS